jgi:peroxiredoxin
LNNTYSQLQDGGLRVLAVNVGEPSVKVERFVQDYGLAFSIVLDENARVAEAYQVMGVPTYAIISKEGNLVFKDNYFPGADYKNLISR